MLVRVLADCRGDRSGVIQFAGRPWTACSRATNSLVMFEQVEIPLGKELHSRQTTVFRHLFGQLVGLLSQGFDFGPQLSQLARSIRRRRAFAFRLNHPIGEALIFRGQFGQLIVLLLE